MVDPQILVLALGAWSLGVLVGGVGVARHAYHRYVRVARQATRPTVLQRPFAALAPSPPPVPRWPLPRPARAPVATVGRIVARGICLLCEQRWGTCEHTRNG